MRFSNKDLKNMIVPLFFEQLLVMLVGIVLDMGVIGIAFAMCTDWLFKGVLLEFRLRKGTWKQFKVI